jgi:CRP/FNR family transcriptional regulator, cyclic AMP receptor protein
MNESPALHATAPSGVRQRRDAYPTLSPVELLRAHPIFGRLPANVVEQLGTYVTKRRVPRGAMIFAKGDRGNGLMAVLRGSVRISVPTLDGREVVLNLIQPGEVFGEMALLDGQPRSADATATEDCELMVIDRRDFIPFAHNRPEVAIKLLEILCGRLRRTNEQVEDVMFMSLPVRLAKLIVKLTKINEHDARPAKLTVTQRELSQMIGMSRESTNKQLRAWEKRRWLRLERGTLTVLDVGAMFRISENDASLA